MVGVSRVINEEVNVFIGSRLVATSQRDLFASGRLPVRTPAEAYRAIALERQASYVGEEQVGPLAYLIAAAPVREGEGRDDRDGAARAPTAGNRARDRRSRPARAAGDRVLHPAGRRDWLLDGRTHRRPG